MNVNESFQLQTGSIYMIGISQQWLFYSFQAWVSLFQVDFCLESKIIIIIIIQQKSQIAFRNFLKEKKLRAQKRKMILVLLWETESIFIKRDEDDKRFMVHLT